MHPVLKIILVLLAINTLVGIITLAREENAGRNFVRACKNICSLDWAKSKDGALVILGLIVLAMLGIVTLMLLSLSMSRLNNKPH